MSDTTEPPTFVNRNLRGARFTSSDLRDVVMRGVYVTGMDIDGELEGPLWVNGVDVSGFVESELNDRFPGRELRWARTPEGLREAHRAARAAWRAALDRVAAMPEGTVDASVAGEWSFAETMRHLVMATDAWLGRAVLGIEQPFHPIGKPYAEYESDGFDMSLFDERLPTFDEVLAVRAERQEHLRAFLDAVTDDDLTALRSNPWFPAHQMTVAECLGVIGNEEFEHLRFALRDLDALAAAHDR